MSAAGVQVISQETIKPSSPTPSHLHTYTLSWLDQITHIHHIPIIFFFSNSSTTSISTLKTSLSKTLALFYPLAGRQSGHAHVDCAGQGVDFFDARVEATLSDLLGQPSPDVEQAFSFLPCSTAGCLSAGGRRGSLLKVQVTALLCGAVAVAACLSHADARSLVSFMQAWGKEASGDGEFPAPMFDAAKFLPPNEKAAPPAGEGNGEECKSTRKRYIIDGSKVLEELTRRGLEATVDDAVGALLWRCAIRARARSGNPARPSVASPLVELREKLLPTSPNHAFGNLSVMSGASATAEVVDMIRRGDNAAMGILEEELKKSRDKIDKDYMKKVQGVDGYAMAYQPLAEAIHSSGGFQGFDLYFLYAWLDLPFYEVDFGWGKPAWVGFSRTKAKNLILLMPGAGEGWEEEEEGRKVVEAWVALEEKDMEEFERDEELIPFVIPHPLAN